MEDASIMDMCILKHGMEHVVSRNKDNMFGTIMGMWLSILNEIIDREGARERVESHEATYILFQESYKDKLEEQHRMMKDALDRGDEEYVKRYLGAIYLINRKMEGRR